MIKITRFQDIPEFPHANYKVNVSIDYIEDWIEQHPELVLNPDFQRGHVWTKKQCIAFMEFFLRGGTSGRDVYFNHPGWGGSYKGDMLLVDGLQRITAARRFMNDEIPIFGSLRSEYTDRLRITTNTFVFHVAQLQTRAEVLQWYIDLNAGGTPHASTEIERVRDLLKYELENNNVN